MLDIQIGLLDNRDELEVAGTQVVLALSYLPIDHAYSASSMFSSLQTFLSGTNLYSRRC